MLLIGESLNVISTKIGRAFKERNPVPIQEEAKKQKELGMDFIDINLGPARKGGPELMEWVVKTVQEVVDDVPLALDTSNIEAIEAGLAVCNGRPLINSIMCRPARYEKMLPICAKYNARMIALLWGPHGMPRDEHERAELAVELVYAANEAGIANEDIFIDGIVTPVNVQQDQVYSLLQFMPMVQDLGEGLRSTCGLSNVSNGSPNHLRPIINRTYMVMLEKNGLYSAIADAYDKDLVDIARGRRSDIVEIIGKVMDEEPIDMSSISKELQDYVKTARILLKKALYSDSWLEL
ncbi:MAG: dihydropteroate synthase [Deltaproteobacteria bacterium]|nr:dihydropteroate synthase [Deltaproteobacteria bacterium]MBW2332538.1 dihydropteroate synthase [Deltaproteobacteria bacterium]MCD6265092.1 dihydropteroate synthase [Deltaproteobacteria bacterium]RLB25810.1 MAG: dihydropteroate synthase [Deltaproteobacteria bacterium]RLJ04575.1 MAG: dihydropteroate synthase [Candidatus Aenigmarchaeota archaeon]